MDAISQAVRDFSLTLVDISTDRDYPRRVNMPFSDYVGDSYCYGREIVLGIYDDPSVRIAAFFHEVGHIVGKPFPNARLAGVSLGQYKHDTEKQAWDEGERIAADYGVVFSEAAIQYRKRCLKLALEYRG